MGGMHSPVSLPLLQRLLYLALLLLCSGHHGLAELQKFLPLNCLNVCIDILLPSAALKILTCIHEANVHLTAILMHPA